VYGLRAEHRGRSSTLIVRSLILSCLVAGRCPPRGLRLALARTHSRFSLGLLPDLGLLLPFFCLLLLTLSFPAFAYPFIFIHIRVIPARHTDVSPYYAFPSALLVPCVIPLSLPFPHPFSPLVIWPQPRILLPSHAST